MNSVYICHMQTCTEHVNIVYTSGEIDLPQETVIVSFEGLMHKPLCIGNAFVINGMQPLPHPDL